MDNLQFYCVHRLVFTNDITHNFFLFVLINCTVFVLGQCVIAARCKMHVQYLNAMFLYQIVKHLHITFNKCGSICFEQICNA